MSLQEDPVSFRPLLVFEREIRQSREIVSELLDSEPSVLVLPAKSENFELATEITASEVLLVSGVKVAE